MHLLSTLHEQLHQLLWGPVMLAAFLAVGLCYTIQTHFFQLRHIRLWLSTVFSSFFQKKTNKSAISPFEAMSTALAGSMGIGNIAGVATALTSGGPGAIFWMWVSAIIGMMTKYAEILLGFRYRCRDQDGRWLGGPMLYIKKGLNAPLLSAFFSIACILTSFSMGNMTQGNAMASVLSDSLHISPLFTGLATVLLTSVVILGGVKRIAKLSGILIPFMSVFYIGGTLLVIGSNITALPAAFQMIFADAFRPKAALGGAAGYWFLRALRIGISRGVFSNEAGLGSSVMAHAAAETNEPVEQGMWGIFEVFADTIVVCTLTALAILTSGVYSRSLYENALLTGQELPNGAVMASRAFGCVFGSGGENFIAFATVVFAFATLIAWSHYGEQCTLYLLGKKAVLPYKLCFLFFILLGCITHIELVWEIADICNALIAVPNLIALTLLSTYVIQETERYLKKIS